MLAYLRLTVALSISTAVWFAGGAAIGHNHPIGEWGGGLIGMALGTWFTLAAFGYLDRRDVPHRNASGENSLWGG